jgi:hypothetical protein
VISIYEVNSKVTTSQVQQCPRNGKKKQNKSIIAAYFDSAEH